jgi:hypothetical protein
MSTGSASIVKGIANARGVLASINEPSSHSANENRCRVTIGPGLGRKTTLKSPCELGLARLNGK